MQADTVGHPLRTGQVVRTLNKMWDGKEVSPDKTEAVRDYLVAHLADKAIYKRLRMDCTHSIGREHLIEWTQPTMSAENIESAFKKLAGPVALCALGLEVKANIDGFRDREQDLHNPTVIRQIFVMLEGHPELQEAVLKIMQSEVNPSLPEGLDEESMRLLGGMLNGSLYEVISAKVDAAFRDALTGSLYEVLDKLDKPLLTFAEFSSLYWWGAAPPALLTPTPKSSWVQADPRLGKIITNSRIARQLWLSIESLWDDCGKGHYKSGDLLFRATPRRDAFYSIQGDVRFCVTRPFIRHYDHAALIGLNSRSQPTAYELFNGLRASLAGRLELRRILDEAYRLQIHNLVSEPNWVYFQIAWGANWRTVLSDRYAEAQRTVQLKLHNRETGPEFRTRTAHNTSRGLQSTLMPFGKLRLPPTNFNRIHKELTRPAQTDERAPKDALCSEFVADVMIASIVELNEMLKKEIPGAPDNMVSMPFWSHRNLRSLLPEQMLKDLKKDDLIVPLAPPHPLCNLTE